MISMNNEMNKRIRTRICLIAAVGITIVATLLSCEDNITRKPAFGDEEYRTIEQYIRDNEEEFSMFIELMELTELDDALGSHNPHGNNYTLFLPTNAAFLEFLELPGDSYDSFDQLLEDISFCYELSRYHLVTGELHSNDFPYGALPDSTASGEYLTMGFSDDLDTTYYKVNNLAPIIRANIQNYNGYVNVISQVLEPIVFTSYDWLIEREGYSIMSAAFEVTGLADTMGIHRMDELGKVIRNEYSLLIEPDSIYFSEGIYTLQDLIALKSPDNQDFKNETNGLYQFAAYHLLEGSHFLDELESRNYNTYASLPIRINTGYDIRINVGTQVFDTLVSGTDTTLIDYLEIDYQNSNILTKNGAIHHINHILDLFQPAISTQTFQFTEEEPILQEALQERGGEYFFENNDDFSNLSWSGVNQLAYYATSSSSEQAWNKDYLMIDGDFEINYRIPKIMMGKYAVKMRANRNSHENATIQVFIDGKKVGGNINLTLGGSSSNPYDGGPFTLGNIEFSNTQRHTVTVRSLIPGRFIWDLIQFDLPDE
jgi:uncharacterized surface protein with fasciclin (FAS1) repeats